MLDGGAHLPGIGQNISYLFSVLGLETRNLRERRVSEQVGSLVMLCCCRFTLAQVGSAASSSSAASASPDKVTAGIKALCGSLFNSDLSLAATAAAALGHVGLRTGLPLALAAGDESKETPSGELKAMEPSQKVVALRLLELMKEREMKVRWPEALISFLPEALSVL